MNYKNDVYVSRPTTNPYNQPVLPLNKPTAVSPYYTHPPSTWTTPSELFFEPATDNKIWSYSRLINKLRFLKDDISVICEVESDPFEGMDTSTIYSEFSLRENIESYEYTCKTLEQELTACILNEESDSDEIIIFADNFTFVIDYVTICNMKKNTFIKLTISNIDTE